MGKNNPQSNLQKAMKTRARELRVKNNNQHTRITARSKKLTGTEKWRPIEIHIRWRWISIEIRSGADRTTLSSLIASVGWSGDEFETRRFASRALLSCSVLPAFFMASAVEDSFECRVLAESRWKLKGRAKQAEARARKNNEVTRRDLEDVPRLLEKRDS